MTNQSGYGMAIALPFFVLWLTLENVAYLCIAIALAFSSGAYGQAWGKKKDRKEE
jgi:hypothetical protein